ncbi:hypothetical protein PVBG_05201 [Plasmodium vivax Brazil I]|uniref:Uncharacterized protein n=1 Tax=Plasmodium vivax (strain Brazil I) TaxID=1033975 RepID=A0A0J9SKP9_PLAV1|nr:hypothetical protein PVBG_05201 [Plasmodium vivax Brazil I]
MRCESHYNDFEEKDALKDICVRFKCLYSLLFDPNGVNAYSNNENVEFLNYWLNNELKNEMISSISAPNFYQKLIFYDILFDSEKRLRDKIRKIKEEHLKQMDILYDLNTIYNNIKSNLYDDKQKCINYSNECVQKYKEAIKPCSTNKNTKYCNALMVFKIKYENIEGIKLFGEHKSECLLPLPSLGEESVQNAVVMSPGKDRSEVELILVEKKEQRLEAEKDLEEFTPNGFKLNKNRSKKKQNNYHNNGGNRKGLLEYEKKTVNGTSNKKRLGIAYHST